MKESMPDQKIFSKSVNEKRLLLTKDRDFKKLDPQEENIIYLRGETLDDWAKQLKDEAEVDWLFSPFSRCLQCNSLLKKYHLLLKIAQPPKISQIFGSAKPAIISFGGAPIPIVWKAGSKIGKIIVANNLSFSSKPLKSGPLGPGSSTPNLEGVRNSPQIIPRPLGRGSFTGEKHKNSG